MSLRAKQYFVCIFSLCILMYLVLYFYLLPSEVVVDEQYGHGDEDLLIQKKGLEESVILQKCSTSTDNCYVVVDRKVQTELGQMVERHMYVKGFEDESDTIVRLIPQGEKTFEYSDTRMWKVDHLSIRAQYIAALISAPFIVSALSLVDSDNDGKTILEIGLGGGSLDMFLHQLNPKLDITAVELDPVVVEIAHNWFSVSEDSTRRTLVTDGLEFIKNARKSGDKYDVVFLDACDSSITIPCPSKIFRTPEIYYSFSEIIKTSGAFIVNILSQDEDVPDVLQIVEDMSQHFGSCLKISITDEINIIVVCTKQAISDSPANIDFLRRRAHAVTMQLGLHDVLKTIKMN
uniref:Methyltransferase-like protein 13 n=1 Tax=Caenorhabditis tropicalis TaxID=1561998 RepID=A0A1I7U3X0_9PELO